MVHPSRQLARAAAGAVAVTVATVGWLVAAPVVQYLALRRLRAHHPEMFDGPTALAAVKAAINQDTT